MRTKLCGRFPILSCTCPIIWPSLVSVCPQIDHGLDGESHASLCLPHCLVLRIVWYVRCTVEELVHAVAHISLDHAAISAFCKFLNCISRIAEQHSRLNELNRLFETIASSLHNTHRVGVRLGFVADIVCFVEISVVTTMEQCNVNVDNIAIDQCTLIWNTMAYHLVDRGTDRLGKVTVVEGRWV